MEKIKNEECFPLWFYDDYHPKFLEWGKWWDDYIYQRYPNGYTSPEEKV